MSRSNSGSAGRPPTSGSAGIERRACRARGPVIPTSSFTAPPGSGRRGRDPRREDTWRYGPDRLGPLLGRPPSTVHRVLARHGLSRLRDADRVTAAPIRYVACHPGALVHQDHKKLGRIPDGGGWRAVGRRPRSAAPERGRVTTTSRSSSTTPAGMRSSCPSPTRRPPARSSASRSRRTSSPGSASGSSGS